MSLRFEDGFSIVEMLLVVLITSLVMAGTATIFKNVMQLNEASILKSDSDQNFRAAANLLTRDMMQAGQGIPTGGIPIPTGTGILAIHRPGPSGSNLTFPSGYLTIPSITPGDGMGPTILAQNTDMITVLFADNTLALNSFPLQSISTDGATMTFNSSTPITGSNGIAAGDLILFNNAVGYAMQQVTSVNGTQTVTMSTGDSMNLNQRSATQGTLLQLKSGGVFPPTTATRIWMIGYYLDVSVDAEFPRLMRQVNNHTPRAVALGIENLQLSYDLVDGVTNPANVSDTTTPNLIRKANLVLGVRSAGVHSQTKEIFRNNLRTQVSFRSLAFVDRYR